MVNGSDLVEYEEKHPELQEAYIKEEFEGRELDSKDFTHILESEEYWDFVTKRFSEDKNV